MSAAAATKQMRLQQHSEAVSTVRLSSLSIPDPRTSTANSSEHILLDLIFCRVFQL